MVYLKVDLCQCLDLIMYAFRTIMRVLYHTRMVQNVDIQIHLYGILKAFVYGKVEGFNVMSNKLLQGLKRRINFLFFALITILPDAERQIASRSFHQLSSCKKGTSDFPSLSHVRARVYELLIAEPIVVFIVFPIAKNGSL